MKKIKKFKIKQNSNNEYSSYHYFIPKSEHIKFADARTLDTEIGDLRNQINELEEKTQYLIDKAPLIGFEEGESSLNLRGCANDKIRKVGIYGNSKQEIREGHNLLDVTTLTDAAKGTNIQVDDEFYVSDSTNTNDSRAWNYTSCNWNNLNLKSGTYTIILLFQKQCTSNSGYMGIYNEYNNAISSELSNHITGVSKYIRTIKISQDQKIGIEVKGFDGIYRIMLLEGEYTSDTIPQYEPYGVSPSPEFPSEIVTVGQNINIFDKNNANIIENAFINSSSNIIASVVNRRCFYLACKPNKIYTILREKVGSAFIVGTTNEVPTIDSTIIDINYNNNEITVINTSENANYLVCYYKKTASEVDEDILNNIKIVEGTEVGGYSPYGQGCIEIEVCNKNLFDNEEQEIDIVGINTVFIKNKIILNGTANANSNIYGFNKDIFLKKGTYIFSYKCENKPRTNSSQIIFRNENNKDVILLNCWYDTLSISKTFEEDTIISKDRSYFYTNKNFTYQNTIFTLQIEKDISTTTYIEHESYSKTLFCQEPMRKLDNIKDTFIKIDNKWYEKHNIAKIILDGTEGFSLGLQGDVNQFRTSPNFLNNLLISPDPFQLKEVALSNYFVKLTNANEVKNIGFTLSGMKQVVLNTNFETVSELQSWLSNNYLNNNPLEIYYLLDTPKLIECTEEQGEMLNSFYTYKGVTNIYSTHEIDPYLKIIYKKDINALIADSGV